MSAVELGSGQARRGVKRNGFRLDMTPLVDVAFLLLTFFMFATTMSQPHSMQVQVPAGLFDLPVEPRNLLTIMVAADNEVFLEHGTMPGTYRKLSLSDLRHEAVSANRSRNNSLITILKVDRAARYETMVTVLDQLNHAESDLSAEYAALGTLRERRFSIVPMEQNVKVAIDGL